MVQCEKVNVLARCTFLSPLETSLQTSSASSFLGASNGSSDAAPSHRRAQTIAGDIAALVVVACVPVALAIVVLDLFVDVGVGFAGVRVSKLACVAATATVVGVAVPYSVYARFQRARSSALKCAVASMDYARPHSRQITIALLEKRSWLRERSRPARLFCDRRVRRPHCPRGPNPPQPRSPRFYAYSCIVRKTPKVRGLTLPRPRPGARGT